MAALQKKRPALLEFNIKAKGFKLPNPKYRLEQDPKYLALVGTTQKNQWSGAEYYIGQDEHGLYWQFV